MARDDSMKLTAATLGRGVVRPRDYCLFVHDEAMVVPVYSDQDQSVVVWNLEPGQENTLHVHAANAHSIVVLQGSGVYLRGEDEEAAITAGDCIIVPRGTAHGIRNTGDGPLSYLAFTTAGEGGYVRGAVGS
ncbi:MAG TPA: cupin domain-containing protein [Chloroflexota bacterium]|nr:cupin domain-containing protein [Chloroflexota bacterium]